MEFSYVSLQQIHCDGDQQATFSRLLWMASYCIPLLGGIRETLEGKEQLFALETVLDFSLTAFFSIPWTSVTAPT